MPLPRGRTRQWSGTTYGTQQTAPRSMPGVSRCKLAARCQNLHRTSIARLRSATQISSVGLTQRRSVRNSVDIDLARMSTRICVRGVHSTKREATETEMRMSHDKSNVFACDVEPGHAVLGWDGAG